MVNFLANKNILLGVTGSIAAYKSADLVRQLRAAGAKTRVVMTEGSKRFITPLTLQAVSGFPVCEDLFDEQAEAAMSHIELARWADLILVAPASADFICRLSHGNANDLLTTLCLATNAAIAIAPAMNQVMWSKAITQENVARLKDKNVQVFGPGRGEQACGEFGLGRMLEPAEIVSHAQQLFSQGELAGYRVVVTAGPTHEAFDPVRYVTNKSSGKMGYAIAQAAREAGADVSLISGPVAIKFPDGVQSTPVINAQEMYEAVHAQMQHCDIFISVAAVCDYRPAQKAVQKIKKAPDSISLKLERNPDIVASVAQLANKPYVVGFAAETENVIAYANEKRARKHMDMIVANVVGENVGMDQDDNAVTVITAHGQIELANAPKTKIARQLIQIISAEYKKLGKNHDGKTRIAGLDQQQVAN